MHDHNEAEARARWGDTPAYHEHKERTKHYTEEKWAEVNGGLMAIFAEFAACRENGNAADSSEAKALAAGLQAYVSANYYTCTDEILAGLGMMYTADGRFKERIDRYGAGTADYAAAAIVAYTEGRKRR